MPTENEIAQQISRQAESGSGSKPPKWMWVVGFIVVLIIGAGSVAYFMTDIFNSDSANIENAVVTNQPATNAQSANTSTTNAATDTLFEPDSTNTSNANLSSTNATTENAAANTATDTSPASECPTRVATDPDCDRLGYIQEAWYGTTEGEADTDGDGFDDYTEVMGCYNPLGEGRMTLAEYTAYCIASSTDSLGGVLGLSDATIARACELWKPFAQQIIDAHTAGGDVDELISNFSQSTLYQQQCPSVDALDGVDTTICPVLQIMISGFCHEAV